MNIAKLTVKKKSRRFKSLFLTNAQIPFQVSFFLSTQTRKTQPPCIKFRLERLSIFRPYLDLILMSNGQDQMRIGRILVPMEFLLSRRPLRGSQNT